MLVFQRGFSYAAWAKPGGLELLYRSPHLYEWSLKHLHGQDLSRRFEKIASIIGKRSVLDVACGTGFLAEYLLPEAAYTGIDLNKRFLGFSKRKGLQVHHQDVMNVQRYPEADTYVICDLLHHIMPHHQTLLERVLALGKTVIVCEPSIPSKSKFRRFMVRAILDNDFINPPRLDLSWYTDSELEHFYREVMQPTEVLRIGNNVIAIREVCVNS